MSVGTTGRPWNFFTHVVVYPVIVTLAFCRLATVQLAISNAVSEQLLQPVHYTARQLGTWHQQPGCTTGCDVWFPQCRVHTNMCASSTAGCFGGHASTCLTMMDSGPSCGGLQTSGCSMGSTQGHVRAEDLLSGLTVTVATALAVL